MYDSEFKGYDYYFKFFNFTFKSFINYDSRITNLSIILLNLKIDINYEKLV
jgi:hypothetical protein